MPPVFVGIIQTLRIHTSCIACSRRVAGLSPRLLLTRLSKQMYAFFSHPPPSLGAFPLSPGRKMRLQPPAAGVPSAGTMAPRPGLHPGALAAQVSMYRGQSFPQNLSTRKFLKSKGATQRLKRGARKEQLFQFRAKR